MWIHPVVAELRHRQFRGALVTFVGALIWAWWANYHGVARLQDKTVPAHLSWSESSKWWLSHGVRKVWPGWTNGMTDERTERDISIVPHFFSRQGSGQQQVGIHMNANPALLVLKMYMSFGNNCTQIIVIGGPTAVVRLTTELVPEIVFTGLHNKQGA